MNVSSWLLPALLWVMFSLTSPLGAQTVADSRLPEFSMLGMDESQLPRRLPDIAAVLRPALGPNGERGRWTAFKTVLYGVPFDTTFYTKNGHVTRIEKLWAASKAGCRGGFVGEDILYQLRAEYGDGQISNAAMRNYSVQHSAVWVVDDVQLSLHTEVSPTRCSTRLVFQPRLVKDGSEL